MTAALQQECRGDVVLVTFNRLHALSAMIIFVAYLRRCRSAQGGRNLLAGRLSTATATVKDRSWLDERQTGFAALLDRGSLVVVGVVLAQEALAVVAAVG